MKLTVANRIMLLILTTMIGLCILVSISIVLINKVFDKANFANVNTVPSIINLSDTNVNFQRARLNVLRNVTTKDSAEKLTFQKTFDEKMASSLKAFKDYKSKIAGDKDQEFYSQEK